ncbi:MAG TPA: hypothetical protein VN903_00365 [Polyangia bacterium]|jgi:hypothetical protein|nr:hypothetical protein [Polyangia bacterium]
MAGRIVLAVVAALMIASCSDHQYVGGCSGTAVIIDVSIPVDAGTYADASTDGGSFNGRPGCNLNCQAYLEMLRAQIESATGATCEQITIKVALACVSSPTSWCAKGTLDASTTLETQIRDYLSVSRPEIGADAVSLETCMCTYN